jgi:peptide/nickel transport system substrate-binding protein
VVRVNPRWWGPAPQVRSAFRAVPNVASRVADLQSRKADLVTTLTPDAANQITRDPKPSVLSTPTERVAYVAFNTIKGGPANDPRVRHVIVAAINYEALIKNLQRGYAKPINSLLSPLAYGSDTSLPDNRYDPATAKILIDEAGVRVATVGMATSPRSGGAGPRSPGCPEWRTRSTTSS